MTILAIMALNGYCVNPYGIFLASYNQVSAEDDANSVVGAYVSGPGIAPGTKLSGTALIDQNQFVLSENAPSTKEPALFTFSGRPLLLSGGLRPARHH
jgi:hypothetical protein